jgi:hypothetical protein
MSGLIIHKYLSGIRIPTKMSQFKKKDDYLRTCTGHDFNVPIRSDGESIRRGDVVGAHHGFLLDTAAGGGGLQDGQHHVEGEGFWDHTLNEKIYLSCN